MLGSRVHEDLLAEGEDGDSHGENSGCQVDNILGLILVINLKEGMFINLESEEISSGLTCFQDSVGTPISSMLGLAQLARAFPLVWFFISLLAARKERAPTIF